MNKIKPLIAILIIILSGIGAIANSNEIHNKNIENFSITFSNFNIIQSQEDYIEIQFEEAQSEYLNPGKPLLPKFVKTLELPFGVTDVQINVEPKIIKEYYINKEILPSPRPVSEYNSHTDIYEKDLYVYESKEFYPDSWYGCHVSCGLNKNNEHVTFVPIHIYPIRYSPLTGKIIVAEDMQISITYESSKKPITFNNDYDMVIISPKKFAGTLKLRLVPFKNSHGIKTFVKTTEDIYEEYEGRDKPEQIKYFIKDAIEQKGIKYVLLVGGLKSYYNNIDRDDCNQGSSWWHLPVRYTNIHEEGDDPYNPGYQIGDPGFVSDLYYSDIYRANGEFEDWDSDGDGVFAVWHDEGTSRDVLDLVPDVYVGRLACRNRLELKIVIDKIIKYERKPADPTWFNKVITISGDSFQDQDDLDFRWDVGSLADDNYTLTMKCWNLDGVESEEDVVNVILDRTRESSIKFVEDDNLRVSKYPANPIVDITSPSEGDIIGNTWVSYTPRYAYSGDYWAKVEYIGNIMHVRGKSYDPRPYGNYTTVNLIITNSSGQIVFEQTKSDIESIFEGEWTCGDKYLYNRTGIRGYMSEDFEVQYLWTSNGEFTGMNPVRKAWNQGAGFIFLSGHGSCHTWSQHNPGIPGGRSNSSIIGISILNPIGIPFFPMNRLLNKNKLPVVVTSLGCHLSQINVSFIPTAAGLKYYWSYGVPTIKCWSWYLTSLPKRGAIATIGNTGIGYAWLGSRTLIHGSGYFGPEFFRLYTEEAMINIGQAHSHAMTNYIIDHGVEYWSHVKMMCEWILLGDPSLMIGGYS